MNVCDSQFSLCWDNYQENLLNGMRSMLLSEDLVDVTLAVEGKYLKAHKMVLSLCSPYFKELFNSSPCKHPIVFLKDVNYTTMENILEFVYRGQVNVDRKDIEMFLKTSEALQIKGLTEENQSSFEADETIENESDDDEIVEKEENVDDTFDEQFIVDKEFSPFVKIKKERRSEKSVDCSAVDDLKGIMQEDSTNGQICINIVKDKSTVVEEENEDFGDMDAEEMPQTSTTKSIKKIEDCKDKMLEYKVKIENSSPKSAKRIRSKTRTRYVFNGFVYHNKVVSGTPPMRYLGCAEIKRTGCRARAIVPVGGGSDQLRVTKQHNHPPDYHAEEKLEFLTKLKSAVKTFQGTLKQIYDNIADIYPHAAQEIQFKSICSSMHRWRKGLTS